MAIGDKVRRAMEAKALAEAGVSEDESATEERAPETATVPFDMREFAQILAQAIAQGQSGSTEQNRAFMEQVIEKARNRRPESYNGDFAFPNKSAFNPDGDAKPAPPLKCEMWEGFWDPKQRRAVKGHPIEQGDDGLGPLSKREVRLLNQLQPGVYTITNNDDEPGQVNVSADLDAGGTPTLIIIAYPLNWVDNDGKKKKPSIVKVCCEIFDLNPRKPSEIDAWLDAKDAEMVAA